MGATQGSVSAAPGRIDICIITGCCHDPPRLASVSLPASMNSVSNPSWVLVLLTRNNVAGLQSTTSSGLRAAWTAEGVAAFASSNKSTAQRTNVWVSWRGLESTCRGVMPLPSAVRYATCRAPTLAATSHPPTGSKEAAAHAGPTIFKGGGSHA